jgi:hypothetical protein
VHGGKPVHLTGTHRLGFAFKKARSTSKWCVVMREYPDPIDHLYSNNEHQWLCGISVAMPLQPTYWS